MAAGEGAGHGISIHTFLTEGDVVSVRCAGAMVISIHTFLAEGDNKLAVARYTLAVFQSTPSLQKVTFGELYIQLSYKNFNPHLPCGRWHISDITSSALLHFNPHLPCGRWLQVQMQICHSQIFQSTPSLRKVTARAYVSTTVTCNFNPHLPCGRWRMLTLLM